MKRENLERVYQRLFEAYGPQHWWPAESQFEVMVGAVLTQNAAWSNVEKAIDNLKAADSLELEKIYNSTDEKLAELIRPSGYFNVKTKRLKNLCRWFEQQGGFKAVEKTKTNNLRNSLLSVNGIGPETADDILLYAFERPVFVIDAYTRRLFSKLDLINGDENYETLRCDIEAELSPDVPLYNEYHALIVRHAKEQCEQLSKCKHCRVEAPIVI